MGKVLEFKKPEPKPEPAVGIPGHAIDENCAIDAGRALSGLLGDIDKDLVQEVKDELDALFAEEDGNA